MKIIETKNLCKVYGKKETEVKALDNVNISIEKGEFVSIIGDSGSGKSTLLHILGTVDTPTSGNVFFEGIDLFKKNENDLSAYRRNNIGFIFQFFNLVPVLTVEENISIPFILNKKIPDKRLLDEIISFLRLEDKRKSLPNQLSGGQQQRVAVGRAIIHNPKIIFADEPTGNLDSKNSKDIISLLSKLSSKNKQTLILITHDSKVASYADRRIIVEDGKTRQEDDKRYDE